MEINGKAKEDFKNWCIKNNHDKVNIRYNSAKEIEKTFNIFQNTLIIEWFDSVGIYINIENLYYQSWWYYKVKQCPYTYEQVIMQNTRQEAIEKAIEKANEIYNQR